MRRAWSLIVGFFGLVTDGELYMLIWLAIRSRFDRSPAPEIERPKAKAARRGGL